MGLLLILLIYKYKNLFSIIKQIIYFVNLLPFNNLLSQQLGMYKIPNKI